MKTAERSCEGNRFFFFLSQLGSVTENRVYTFICFFGLLNWFSTQAGVYTCGWTGHFQEKQAALIKNKAGTSIKELINKNISSEQIESGMLFTKERCTCKCLKTKPTAKQKQTWCPIFKWSTRWSMNLSVAGRESSEETAQRQENMRVEGRESYWR